jgi:hypothetical protein
MAQTGFTPIQIYSSSTAAAAPTAGNLANTTLGSELAINITDGKLFYKDNAGAIQVIGWKVVPAVAGGTGQTSYAVGDILFANTSTTLAKLADVATGNALISGGVGVAPAYGKIGLTTHVTGVLPVANGGTNASTASITSFNNITGYTASGATGTTSTDLVFSTSPAITTPSVTGDLTMSTGNVVMSNGKGIDFSATPGTGTSELFDDYEEGTWTPVLTTTATDFTSVTYDAAVYGLYTKIGNVVHVQGMMRTDAVNATGATGLPIISGLPFTSSSGAGFRDVAVSITRVEGFVTNNPLSAVINENSTNIFPVYRTTANGIDAYLPLAAIGTGADNNIMYFTGTYIAD